MRFYTGSTPVISSKLQILYTSQVKLRQNEWYYYVTCSKNLTARNRCRCSKSDKGKVITRLIISSPQISDPNCRLSPIHQRLSLSDVHKTEKIDHSCDFMGKVKLVTFSILIWLRCICASVWAGFMKWLDLRPTWLRGLLVCR